MCYTLSVYQWGSGRLSPLIPVKIIISFTNQKVNINLKKFTTRRCTFYKNFSKINKHKKSQVWISFRFLRFFSDFPSSNRPGFDAASDLSCIPLVPLSHLRTVPATASRLATDHYRNPWKPHHPARSGIAQPAGDNPEAGWEHLRKRKASARHRQSQS